MRTTSYSLRTSVERPLQLQLPAEGGHQLDLGAGEVDGRRDDEEVLQARRLDAVERGDVVHQDVVDRVLDVAGVHAEARRSRCPADRGRPRAPASRPRPGRRRGSPPSSSCPRRPSGWRWRSRGATGARSRPSGRPSRSRSRRWQALCGWPSRRRFGAGDSGALSEAGSGSGSVSLGLRCGFRRHRCRSCGLGRGLRGRVRGVVDCRYGFGRRCGFRRRVVPRRDRRRSPTCRRRALRHLAPGRRSGRRRRAAVRTSVAGGADRPAAQPSTVPRVFGSAPVPSSPIAEAGSRNVPRGTSESLNQSERVFHVEH